MKISILITMVGFLSASTVLADPELTGTWTSPCDEIEDDDGNPAGSELDVFEIGKINKMGEAIAKSVIKVYTDKECKEGGKDEDPLETTLKIGSAKDGIYKIDFVEDEYFTIFKITDKSKLTFGLETDDKDGSTDEKRPTDLDDEFYYTKK